MAFSASPHGLTQVSIMMPLYEHVNMCATLHFFFFFFTSGVKDAVVTSLNPCSWSASSAIPLINKTYKYSFTLALVTESKWCFTVIALEFILYAAEVTEQILYTDLMKCGFLVPNWEHFRAV